MMLSRLILAAAVLAPVSVLAAQGADHSDNEGGFTAKLSYERTVGKYGLLRDTTISTSSMDVTWENDDYGLDLLLPYLRRSGPGSVITIAGRRAVVTFDPNAKASGRGDVTIGLTRYLLNEEDHGFDLDLGAIYKLSTASAPRGLGSGKEDLSLQSAIGRSIGALTPTLTVGYTFVGKEAALGLQNAFYGSLDLSYKVFGALSVGVTYNAGGAIVNGSPDSRDATAYVTVKPLKGARVEVYYLKGWSAQSPDRGGGMNVSLDL
jgi:hypothetical protein